MSEGDVNLIRDEDVLRRMWQQTEDFGRKKEIRAHMYRLREERLRNLYSPEPTAGKGCEFSSGQAHVDSFADQTFQSMKSKEVRDAGSPPKEFTYRGQELKERSNAGWNVESEDRTMDDGRTHVKSVNANIEGQYDVDGGRGQFAAVDHQRHAVTEFQDDNTQMRRDESSSGTTAREHVERRAADGTRVASTTSSSNTSSRVQQVSSTVHETPAIHDYDQPTNDSNRFEKVTNTTNSEQNLRNNDLQCGELVSRKIDYPDDNTKVIVETRCLPDGTRVTSTRKEFRAPAQSTRSEYQSKSESKSYSSQQKSDFQDSSSKTIRHTTDSRTDDNVRNSKIIRQTTDDIVDSQRHVDDYDFKRQLREYSVDDDTASETHRTTRRHITNISKVTDRSQTDVDSQTRYETKVKNNETERSKIVRDSTDDSTKVQRQRHVDNVDETDRREVIESRDDRSFSQKDIKTAYQGKNSNEEIHSTKKVIDETSHTTKYEHEPNRNDRSSNEEPCHHVPRATDEPGNKTLKTNETVVITKNADDQTHITRHDTKLEEVVERKTSSDHYQTTYQSDFQQKKVSNDWSPTHQAWASTLRADTPPTTRPSTRASSPGSKTFKSSSSSLRSSVSPDKTFRKPTSRGGSPNKVDRYSPTRSMTSDRYSNTHSTHSVTEVRTNRYTSPERKPPSGRAPAGYSPDRKPHDSYCQRPSVSPDKRPQNSTSRPNASPERISTHKRPSDGLNRNTSPTRAAGLPSVPKENAEKQTPQPSLTSPYPSRTSPEQKPTANFSKPASSKKSPSPDRIRSDDFQMKHGKSPEREVGFKQPSPSRDFIESIKQHSLNPDMKPGYIRPTSASQPSSGTKRPSKPGDESGKKSPTFRPSQSPDRKPTKTVSQVQNDHYKFVDEETKMYRTRMDKHSLPHDKSPVSTRKSPSADNEITPSKERSLSPHKKTLIVTEIDEFKGKINNSIEQVDTNTIKIDKPKDIPRKETSPTQFGTYDKKKSRTEITKDSNVTETEHVEYESLKRREQKSPKRDPENTATTKSLRNSLSPVKSPTKDSKFKNTTDFISTERTTEETTKKTTTKEHPRQLLTPSSSPTRKPKVETEPSTGQSSPTTSVSGFVYFGSPRTEKPVTDLDDDFEPDTDNRVEPQYKRPDSLELARSTSPSKIPCRSPSPKRNSPAKETLPRKSSLKKLSNFGNPVSPIDKPPSSFSVSPTKDNPDIIGHKVVKKDQPDEPQVNSPIKAKPPLTRRETYEDRCRLILGMVNSSANENINKVIKKSEVSKTDKKSTSVSPCDSPIPQESARFPEKGTLQKNIKTEIDVTDFITKEQEEIIKSSSTHNQKSKIASRESSPTKLQDIISKITSVTQSNDTTTKAKAYQSPRQSPENVINRASKSPVRLAKQNIDDKPISKLPQAQVFDTYLRETSPTKLSRPSISPERKPSVTESPENGPGYNQPKETSPTKTVKIHLDKKTTEQSVFDSISTSGYNENQQTITIRNSKEKSPRTRILESPTRQYSSTIKCESSNAQTFEPEIIKTPTDNQPISKSPNKQLESPEKTRAYLKTTTDLSSKYDTFSTTEEIDDTSTCSTLEMRQKSTKTSVSPTRTIVQGIPRSVSPTKSTQQTSVIPKNEQSPERKQPRKDLSENNKEPKKSSPKDVRELTKTTASTTSKNDVTITESETIFSKTVEKKNPLSQTSRSPTRKVPGPRMPSPTKLVSQPNPENITKKPKETPLKEKSPILPRTADGDYPGKTTQTIKTTDYQKATTNVIAQFDSSSMTNDFEAVTSTEVNLLEPNIKYPGRTTQSPVRKSAIKETTNYSPEDKPSEKKPSVSPDRKPSYMKPTASMISKHETTTNTKESQETKLSDKEQKQQFSQRASLSSQSPEKTSKKLRPSPEEPRQLRTPSPTKKTIKVTEVSTEFLMSEREKEILDRVQKSLRKLSPDRKEKSPSRETSQTTSLQDLDITSATKSVETQNKEMSDIFEDNDKKTHVPRSVKTESERPKDKDISSKLSSRNVSPIKKAPSVTLPRETEKKPETLTKSRSISPRKPLSQTDRPQSPRGTRASGIRPRDQVPFNRKPTPATLSTYRIDKVTTDFKKTNGATKHSVVSKTATSKTTPNRNFSPNLTEAETKRIPTKSIKENISPSKHVMRTASDSNIKPKKTSPQRIKSKPEIQVNDIPTKSPKYQKPITKDCNTRLPIKPKSATALNTSIDDDDDVIIDVQQSKSSRENSPDRICPTPVNFSDDVGIPRFPDEVSEPDDEYRKRTYHTIHETESVVDDIIEICEDEELFVKNTDVTSEYEDNILSVDNKVRKHTTKVESVTKPNDTISSFKDTERRVHSDFSDENRKSDQCLLSVSEKVNKFAKGPRDTKDIQSPSRKITDEYDKNTIYQDDYTKLSVNDKAHLFVETAENIKVPKVKLAQKVQRPDLSDVDESLKKDDCLLSVSDKVNKFVKTAESFLTETHEVNQKERKIKEQHEKIIRQIVDTDDQTYKEESITTATLDQITDKSNDQPCSIKKEAISQPKDYSSPKLKPIEITPTTKLTTLRSSEAVKKAKALFENIASTQITKDVTKTTKLTDIGVVKKSSITDSTIVLHPSAEDVSPDVINIESEVDAAVHTRTDERYLSGTPSRPHRLHDDKPRVSPNRLAAQTPEVSRSKSPMRQTVEITTTKTVLTKYPGATRADSPRARPESPRHLPETDKVDKVPGYLRPTKTSQIKEETKVVEESEVSTRRGSGKFGVELRRTSTERATISSERRRSDEHHQPCIEDIFDLDLLEQMLEKVVGYEQRRRIRSQIRIVKNQTEQFETHTYNKAKNTASTIKTKAPEQLARSPDRVPKSAPQQTLSPERHSKTPQRTHSDRIQNKEPAQVINGHAKEPAKTLSTSRLRPHSPEKSKSIRSAKSPIRQPSPVKKRTVSPTKTVTKPKASRFNEYASAYMKKVGLNETDKVKFADKKIKKASDANKTVSRETQSRTSQEFTTTKSFTTTTERTSSKDVIEFVQVNGKRSTSPEGITSILRKPQSPERRMYSPVRKAQSPERRVYSPVGKTHSPERAVQSPVRKAPDQKVHSPERKLYSPINKTHASDGKVHSPARKVQSPEHRVDSPECKVSTPTERLYQRSPSPEFKRQKSDTKIETIIKTVYDTEKKIPGKPVQDEKPSWVTNRNLKKITAETRTFSTKKVETEKPKYRAPSPSKVISKPTDVITSSYGPGPLDADGRPLFGIRALRNGATNFQVKGTVIRQEFHSRNGGEPEGTVSVTAYSSQPEELEQLMASQGMEPPSRIHGLSAITTTKKFGGDTGHSMTSVNTKEERASLEQFTHTDRKMERQIDNVDTFDTREEITEDVRGIDLSKSDTSTRRDDRVTEIRKGQKEDRRAKVERRQDKKTVRQSSVKSLTEKFIKTANDSGKTDRSSYPKAGLILRTTSTLQDSLSSDEASPGLARADSEHSLGSTDDVVVTTSDRGSVTTRTTRHGPTTTRTVTRHEPTITKKTTITTSEPVVTRVVTQGPITKVQRGTVTTERSFLDSSTKVTGVQDILTRMKNADIVIEDGDSTEDSEARALLNKFLGATVLMAGMQSYVTEQPHSKLAVSQETVRTSSGGSKVTSVRVEDIDLDQCWDERLLRKLLDECTDYEQRRRLRARIRTLMAEQEACAAAVTDALGAAHLTSSTEAVGSSASDKHEEEEVTVTSSVRRDSTEKTSSSSTTTKTSKVIESVNRQAPKNVSPFAKFRQLEKQNSTNSPSSPKSPGSPSQPYFKFTDPALQCSAITIKERLLQWCRDKTRDYENVKLENFSTSWADGLAFCALVHHFLPDAFDYSQLSAERRRHNFTLAFKVADEKAGIYPLLDVDDMVAMRKPDWKCVFTYVQAIHRRFKDEA